ncbi:hypothetical protein D3C85_1422450 [compost metagenome]
MQLLRVEQRSGLHILEPAKDDAGSDEPVRRVCEPDLRFALQRGGDRAGVCCCCRHEQQHAIGGERQRRQAAGPAPACGCGAGAGVEQQAD